MGQSSIRPDTDVPGINFSHRNLLLPLHSVVTAIMSEQHRSGGIDKTSDSDIYERGLRQDIVSVVIPPSVTPSCPLQDALAEEIQATEPDLQEATAHARSMTPDEVEETINYIINEVISLSITIADSSFTF